MKKIGFIDNYLDEWHANNYPAVIHRLAGDEMRVTYAYARQDAPGGMTTDEWCEKNGVERVDSIEELVEIAITLLCCRPIILSITKSCALCRSAPASVAT
ncbi:MAG: hypothetical protein IJD01_07620 [Clostridia bacterium]|nr:hypothetical protein [Clostridia bacterium]